MAKETQDNSNLDARTLPVLRTVKKLYTIGGLSVIGVVDAIYLTFKSITGGPVVCSILDGCSLVLESVYAQIWGIPVAVFGIGYYAIILALVIALVVRRKQFLVGIIVGTSILGLLMSGWFVYLQAFVIGSWCQYCLLSAFLTLAIVGVEIWFLRDSHLDKFFSGAWGESG